MEGSDKGALSIDHSNTQDKKSTTLPENAADSSEDEFFDAETENGETERDQPPSQIINSRLISNTDTNDLVDETTRTKRRGIEEDEIPSTTCVDAAPIRGTKSLHFNETIERVHTARDGEVHASMNEKGHASINEKGHATLNEQGDATVGEAESLAEQSPEEEEDDIETSAESKPVDLDEDGEEALKQIEESLSEEEKQARREKAQNFKAEGNKLFKADEYADALFQYSEALRTCPLCFRKERSIMFANRAACKVHLKQMEEAVRDCTKAIDLHPHYLKVILRRAQTYEVLEKLEDALKDYQRALELDPSCHLAREACMRLPDEIKEKNEKLKEEMMSKLKDLGNLVLRPFGLSTNNFQMQQDPSTGSYSINFVQNQKPTNGK